MKLFENHNTAIQKYGEKIVNELTQLGLPPQYLLAACRFNTEDNVPPKTIVIQIREWMTYIAKYENIDINNYCCPVKPRFRDFSSRNPSKYGT